MFIILIKMKAIKKLLMNLDGSNWKLCDLNGIEEMVIDINVVVPPYPVEAVIDDNGTITIT